MQDLHDLGENDNDEYGDGGDAALFFRLQSKNEAKLFVKELKLKNIPTKMCLTL